MTPMPQGSSVSRWQIIFMMVFCMAVPGRAFAHGVETGFVLLLPTGYYMAGASLSVALTFVLLAVLSGQWVNILYGHTLESRGIAAPSGVWPASLAFILLLVMLLAGVMGTRDPLLNPLPAFVWTVFWVCFTLMLGVVGPLWRVVNPWRAPVFVCVRLLGLKPHFQLPTRIGYGVACLQFYAFAWFEIVDLAPSDPSRLAVAVSLYWLFNFLGMLLVGQAEWTERAEPFSIFFRLVARLAPLDWSRTHDGLLHLRLGFPGWNLVDAPPLPASGVAFILLTLSAVSFDGLSRSFIWLSVIGINPLEYPGRSAVLVSSSIGILLMFLAMWIVYCGSVYLGCRLARQGRPDVVAGRLIYSIIPISLAFQFSHYLTSVLVELQNFARAISDPFARGLDIFGTIDLHVTASFLNVFHLVQLIFNIQTMAIVAGHGLAVVLAHAILSGVAGRRRSTTGLELPFAALMVVYTAFGLWLLSTPRI